MELYDMLKNITGKNNEEELSKAIATVQKRLNGLTEERMCRIYSSFLLDELHKNSTPAHLINTLDLNMNYEHYFIMVPDNNIGYYLADLTFSQFQKENKEFEQLMINGYQKIEDKELNDYLSIVGNEKLYGSYRVEEVFYTSPTIKQEQSNKH